MFKPSYLPPNATKDKKGISKHLGTYRNIYIRPGLGPEHVKSKQGTLSTNPA